MRIFGTDGILKSSGLELDSKALVTPSTTAGRKRSLLQELDRIDSDHGQEDAASTSTKAPHVRTSLGAPNNRIVAMGRSPRDRWKK
jgi:hypothetical protein